MLDSVVPTARVRTLNDRVPDPNGAHVLYWMTSARRTTFNFALERAVEWACELGRGLVVLEALRCDYEWASDRFHRFVLDGMADNALDARGREGLAWYPFVEPNPGAGKGLLAELAATAAVVVTDDYPTFFIPDMLSAAADRVTVRFEAVDSNGLAPMRGTPRSFPSAYTFRRYLQKSLPDYLGQTPETDPLERLKGIAAPIIPVSILDRWPSADSALTEGGPDLASLPLDHSVGPVGLRGGTRAAGLRLQEFLRYRLSEYADERNHPDEDAASGLSPYLHFGHISVHEIMVRLAEREEWTPAFEDRPTNGKRTGWWGMSPSAEAFLDQVVTWRELGFNMAANRPDHREYESLPEWARETLEAHAGDARPSLYNLEELQAAATHDELWNAAQRQLVGEGIIHNYLRMLWGKKILEWTAEPREAASVMIELNNRYAIDGRDPNSYSGIYWCLGRYDRPWGPERPVFGKIRYMTSRNTARKLRLKEYLERFRE
jgi:deoxyribodipyrimidine photo-lyase